MENQSQRRASGEFQEALSRADAAALPALPAPLDHSNEDNEQRADPGADGKILAQLESGPTGSHAGPSPADDKQVASTGESAARSGSAGHSGS